MAAGCVVGSFGSILTANRADRCSCCLPPSRCGRPRACLLFGLLLAGSLAGLAAGLKLHGPAYMLPAFAWMAVDTGPRCNFGPSSHSSALVAAVALVVPFLPPNIDAANYFSYLRLGAKHGLDSSLVAWGCTFLLCLWVPPLFVVRALRSDPARAVPRQIILFVAALLLTELAVTVIAAKPGAGTHHMLPFVGYHCFLLTQFLQPNDSERPAAHAASFGVALVLFGTSWSTALAIRASVTSSCKGRCSERNLQSCCVLPMRIRVAW